jgi:hypothetical protein
MQVIDCDAYVEECGSSKALPRLKSGQFENLLASFIKRPTDIRPRVAINEELKKFD